MTVNSMTGYASTSKETLAGLLTVEIRSVNSRYLDLQFRLSDELRIFEPLLREAVTQAISRGKVECRLALAKDKIDNHAVNQAILNDLMQLQEQVHSKFPNAHLLTINDILRWPGVIEEADIDQELFQKQIMDAMTETIKNFISSRTREGEGLTSNLLEKVDAMEGIVQKITPLIPQVIEQFQQKSIERMQEALGIAISEPTTVVSAQDIYERIRQEVLLYGTKIDVAEELSRMLIHLSEMRNILKKGGPVGKRLDFMLQELNREANTLGSKATVREVSDASIDLKLLIEQIREQVQNVE